MDAYKEMDPEELDARLDNWGRWSRSGSYRPRRISAGFENFHPWEATGKPPQPIVEVNALDAWFIDRLIFDVCDEFEKWIMVEGYVRFPDRVSDSRFMERTLRLMYGTWSPCLDKAKRKLKSALDNGWKLPKHLRY